MKVITLNRNVYKIDNSNFKRVYKDNSIIAHALNTATALQVIYQDVHENGGECEYLNIEDFREVEDEK